MMRFSFAIGPAVRAARVAARPSPCASRAARAAGIAVGLAVFAVGLHSWTITSTGSALGTDLGVAAVAPGELEVVGSPRLLQTQGLQPGAPTVTGRLRVRNITAVPVRVRVRALPSTRALDDALQLDVTARGRPLATGSAGELRRWSTRRITLGLRQTAAIDLRAGLLRSAQGLVADVTLELDADPVTRR